MHNPFLGLTKYPTELPQTEELWLCSPHYANVNRREGIIWGYTHKNGQTSRYVKEEIVF